MSKMSSVSPNKDKKRPAVSSKCLLNIKSIVAQNVSLNNNNRNSSVRSLPPPPPPPPLPLVSAKESIIQGENEEKKRNRTSLLPTPNVIDGISQKSLDKKMRISNGHDRSTIENNKSIPTPPVREYSDLSPSTSAVISKESNSEQYSSPILNKYESSSIPPLPLCISMYPFGLTTSSPQKKPLTSFPIQSSNRINEGYVAQMRRIIAASADNLEETKLITLSIHRQSSIPIHRLASASPTISTVDDDDDEDDEINGNGPLVFVNRSLNLPAVSSGSSTISDRTVALKSRLSEGSDKKIHQHRKVTYNDNQYQPRCPINYTRLPHSLRNENPPFTPSSPSGSIPTPLLLNLPLRRTTPHFQSVRTPLQESPSAIPAEVFDCCQTERISPITQSRTIQGNPRRKSTTIENSLNETELRSNYFRDVEKIREIMVQASRRLTQDLGSLTSLPIVDTHCHFDLIFDRLRIRHNNLKKYFQDYNEYYPPGLSFELAIQVFWRPKQLLENNWTNWYSKYLDDERVYGACGIHPHWSATWTETSTDDIERCLHHPKVVAIGEIGLDFGPKNLCTVHEQRRAFEGQLKLAAKWLKPIVIHSRNAYEETFQLMKTYLQSNHKIHLHCFVGTIDDVHLFTSYFNEIKFGFTPIITRSNFLHSVIQQLPLTQILSETDSPYFTPEELQTYSRCAHPGMVYSVVEIVAQLRHLPVFDIACQLRENARQMYGI